MSRTLLVRFSAGAIALGVRLDRLYAGSRAAGQAAGFTAKGGLWANPNVVNKLDQIMAELKN